MKNLPIEAKVLMAIMIAMIFALPIWLGTLVLAILGITIAPFPALAVVLSALLVIASWHIFSGRFDGIALFIVDIVILVCGASVLTWGTSPVQDVTLVYLTLFFLNGLHIFVATGYGLDLLRPKTEVSASIKTAPQKS